MGWWNNEIGCCLKKINFSAHTTCDVPEKENKQNYTIFHEFPRRMARVMTKRSLVTVSFSKWILIPINLAAIRAIPCVCLTQKRINIAPIRQTGSGACINGILWFWSISMFLSGINGILYITQRRETIFAVWKYYYIVTDRIYRYCRQVQVYKYSSIDYVIKIIIIIIPISFHISWMSTSVDRRFARVTFTFHTRPSSIMRRRAEQEWERFSGPSIAFHFKYNINFTLFYYRSSRRRRAI